MTDQPVTWRWRPKGSTNWIYDPEPEWLERQGDDIEKEPLYAAPPQSQRTTREGESPK